VANGGMGEHQVGQLCESGGATDCLTTSLPRIVSVNSEASARPPTFLVVREKHSGSDSRRPTTSFGPVARRTSPRKPACGARISS
jgi:hypothetical protein